MDSEEAGILEVAADEAFVGDSKVVEDIKVVVDRRFGATGISEEEEGDLDRAAFGEVVEDTKYKIN